MLATLVPFFDKEMRVSAYSLFSQKNNLLLNPSQQGTAVNDGAVHITGLDIIKNIGIDTLSPGTDVFVPVGPIAVFSDIESQTDPMNGRLVLLFDNKIENDEMYLGRLGELKEKGYKLAIRKLPVQEFEPNREILALMDYIILDCKKVDVTKAKIYFGHCFPQIKICVGNIDNQEIFEHLKEDESFPMFEGKFYRLPVTRGETEVTPLKVNYMQLMSLVNNEDFELTQAADIIGRDTALVVELLKLVNRIAINSKVTSIRHAAAILGQKELKRWINTVITKELCVDRPNEIARLSMLRAKFAECLAPYYGLSMKSSELFLMGLFSVIDIILNLPMEEALQKVNVSKEITDALLYHKGDLSKIYDLILSYENADWQEVFRQLIVDNVSEDAVYDAYTQAVCWYKEMFF